MTNKKAIPEIRFKGFSDLPAGRQALGNWCVYVLLCDDGSLYSGGGREWLKANMLSAI